MTTALALLSCEDEPRPEQELNPEQFTGDKVGLQQAEMGDNIRTIMARESSNIVHQMPDELTARIPINQKDSTYYEITYNFNDGGLYVIDMEIYPRDSSDGRIIFDQFATYYNRRFGNALREGQLHQWSAYSSRQTIVEISMSDKALGGMRPSLSITFFEKQE